jgi:uncharacterized coiled-coil protein SlyX
VREQLEQRLQALKTEFESGQTVLAELEAKQINLRETLLRISGAIQVLEEELGKVDELATADGKATTASPVSANGHVEAAESLMS